MYKTWLHLGGYMNAALQHEVWFLNYIPFFSAARTMQNISILYIIEILLLLGHLICMKYYALIMLNNCTDNSPISYIYESTSTDVKILDGKYNIVSIYSLFFNMVMAHSCFPLQKKQNLRKYRERWSANKRNNCCILVYSP